MHIARMPRGSAALARRFPLVAVMVLGLGCNIFDTEIENPNAVGEDALTSPEAAAAAATSLVNGLGASMIRGVSQVVATSGAVSDELRWIGSREYWKILDDGDISDPVNEYTNGQYAYMSEARWLADFVVAKLEEADAPTPSLLPNRAELARAYVYAGLVYTVIGESYDDFVIASNRAVNAAPVGEAAMNSVLDSAVAFLNRAVALAEALDEEELQRQALGLRARAQFSRAVMGKLRPARTTPADPYVNDPGATADATAALALMPENYRLQFTPAPQNANGFFNPGFEINQRLEVRAGDEYVIANAAGTRPEAGLDGIRLLDPVSGAKDARMLENIDACCRQASGQYIPFVVTSHEEMLLILAEAAIASGDAATARTRINELRAIDGLPAWDGATPAPREMLVHERRVNLFMQGRRLADHYRFGIPADRWVPTSVAARKACFFPISYDERLQNPLAPQPPGTKPASCS